MAFATENKTAAYISGFVPVLTCGRAKPLMQRYVAYTNKHE